MLHTLGSYRTLFSAAALLAWTTGCNVSGPPVIGSTTTDGGSDSATSIISSKDGSSGGREADGSATGMKDGGKVEGPTHCSKDYDRSVSGEGSSDQKKDQEKSTTSPMQRYYGTGGGKELANTTIEGGVTFSQSFIPTTTSELTGFRGYLIPDSDGYGAGTGGIIRFEIQTDDGNGFASGKQVGTGYAEAVHPKKNDLEFALHTFKPPVPVKAGTKYHLVVRNVDPSPDSNYVSMNTIFTGTGPLTENSVNEKYLGESWKRRKSSGMPYLPIGEYHYANGTIDGFGYIHAMDHGQHRHEISKSKSVRQLFTVTGGNKPVRELHFYADHTSGSGKVIAELKSCGSSIKTVEATKLSNKDGTHGQWFTFPFSTILKDGVSYELEFRANGNAKYEGFVFRNGASFGFSPRANSPTATPSTTAVVAGGTGTSGAAAAKRAI